MKRKHAIVLGMTPFLLVSLLTSCGGLTPTSSSSSEASSSKEESTSSIVSSSSKEEESSKEESSSEEVSSSEKSSHAELEPENVKKKIDVDIMTYYPKNDQETYKDEVYYDDDWFFASSQLENPGLALFSAIMGGVTTTIKSDRFGSRAKSVLEEAGYHDVELNSYYQKGVMLDDSIGVMVGRKKIKDASNKVYTLLSLIPRNAGYEAEWYGDFEMGVSGIHQGFKKARDEVLRFLKQYVDEYEVRGDVKIFASGYSRGGAVTNLVGGYLIDNPSFLGEGIALNPNDVYVYNIATPNTLPDGLGLKEVLDVSGPRKEEGYIDTKVEAYKYNGDDRKIDLDEERYQGIHNYIAAGDYVTMLPFEEWGFDKYGLSHEIVYGDESMLNYLRQINVEVAEKFEKRGTYAALSPKKEIDFVNFEIKDTETLISPEGLIKEHLSALLNLGKDREVLVNKGYTDVLGAVAGIYGYEDKTFLDKAKDHLGDIVKAVFLTYLDSAAKRSGKSDVNTLTSIVTDLLALVGKPVSDLGAYSDQQFLKDILNLLFNDYHNGGAGEARIKNIVSLLPKEYGDLYLKVLEYAKRQNLVLTSVDDLLSLIANYAVANKEDKTVDTIGSEIAKLIPETFLPLVGLFTGKTYVESDYDSKEAMNKAIITDLFDSMVNGSVDSEGKPQYTGPQVRGVLLSIVTGYFLTSTPKLNNLLLNGSSDFDGVVKKDPVPFTDLVGEILSLLVGKDEDNNPYSLEEAGNNAIKDLADKLSEENTRRYYDIIKERTGEFKDILMNLIFNPKGSYSLKDDINTAYNAFDTISFILPAHFHELYISFLKTKIVD